MSSIERARLGRRGRVRGHEANAEGHGKAAPAAEDDRGRLLEWSQLYAVTLGIVGGLALRGFGAAQLSEWFYGGATLSVFVPTAVALARHLSRGHVDVDLIALLAMAAALVLREPLAGAVIAAMLTTGRALERYANARARRELAALLQRAPRVAHKVGAGSLEDVPAAAVEVGDRLLVKAGEIVPTDGVLGSPRALLDEAALTGEVRLLELERGARLRSGGTNRGSEFELQVTARAADSTYAGIVRLVQAAEQAKAPLIRMADRFALPFLALTLVTAAVAGVLAHDPLRALAVLVVATPCPLLIAAPVAMLCGISHAARRGILIKGGRAIEALADARYLLLDKTGTVTSSRPEVMTTETFGALTSDELLRCAASVEQLSTHVFAPAIVAEARRRRLSLSLPHSVREEAGAGISGSVDGKEVRVGQLSFVQPRGENVASIPSSPSFDLEGSSRVYVVIDERCEGALLLHNPLRPEAPRVIEALRRDGIEQVYLVTGDHHELAELVGDAIGADRVYSECTPDRKVEVVKEVAARGRTLMVGDGINDAPALALAGVGVAIGGGGGTEASEAADAVLLSDRLDGLLVARRIAKRTRAIARESLFAGMALSFAAMIAAMFGHLTAVQGAVIQELIDVAVIVYALRALGRRRVRAPAQARHALARELAVSHDRLRPRVAEIAELAARLERLPREDARQALAAVQRTLEQDILPHEREEQRVAYASLRVLLKGEDPTGPLIQTHHEIQRRVRLLGRHLQRLAPAGPDPADVQDLRRALVGLHAVLSLHFAQEDELYTVLDEDGPGTRSVAL